MSLLAKTLKINLSPLRLHSASSIQIPQNNSSFLRTKPYVRLTPLNLHSATSFHVPSNNITRIFNNGSKVSVTPLGSPVLRKYHIKSPFRNHLVHSRRRVFPSIYKCNAKRCCCCNYLSCKSTIKSAVNGRLFNVCLASNVD